MADTADRIRVYGATWCPDTLRARNMLNRHHIPYEWHDIDVEPASRSLVEKMHNGSCRVPTIIFIDGSMLVEPSDSELDMRLEAIGH